MGADRWRDAQEDLLFDVVVVDWALGEFGGSAWKDAAKFQAGAAEVEKKANWRASGFQVVDGLSHFTPGKGASEGFDFHNDLFRDKQIQFKACDLLSFVFDDKFILAFDLNIPFLDLESHGLFVHILLEPRANFIVNFHRQANEDARQIVASRIGYQSHFSSSILLSRRHSRPFEVIRFYSCLFAFIRAYSCFFGKLDA
jgi:hypothetical protein